MVWVSDLDAPKDHCKVFVDGSVERVSCDFMLPTLCEMDEHVSLNVDIWKAEFVYAIVAAFVGILLIFLVCCLWCSKSRQRKKERFERRNSIRLSKSSLAGSRSLASMNSTSFTDINYRRRLVAMSPNGTMGTNAGSKTGTINSRNGTYKSATRTSGQGSFDSLAMDKTLNSTVEDSLGPSFDMYDPHSTLGSHLAPNSTSFVETHDVHYAAGNGTGSNLQLPSSGYTAQGSSNVHNATIHSNVNMVPGYNYDYATQQVANNSEWNRTSITSSQGGPPGYPSNIPNPVGANVVSSSGPRSINPPGSSMSTTTPADSVLELKRGLKNSSPATTSTSEDGSSRGSSSGDNAREEDVNHEYQTMERPTYDTSSFR